MNTCKITALLNTMRATGSERESDSIQKNENFLEEVAVEI